MSPVKERLRICFDGSTLHDLPGLRAALDPLAAQRCRHRPLVVLSDSLHARHGAALAGLGLEEHTEVLEVARDLVDLDVDERPAPYLRPLFENLADAQTVIGLTLARRPEFDGMAAQDVLASLIEEAGEAPYRSRWVLAYREGRPCGLVLPSLLNTGTLMGLGVAPWAAAQGLGGALHRHALWQLRALGAERYVDHIDRGSAAMRRICAANGCGVQRVLHQFRLRPMQP